jgi:hypothetical protein
LTDDAPRAAIIGLGAGRIAIGLGLWIAPEALARVLGLRDLGPEALAIARVAGTRDVLLGVWQLRALQDREALVRATTAGAIADAGDALAFAIATRDPRARGAGWRGILTAVPATAVGLWAGRAFERQPT